MKPIGVQSSGGRGATGSQLRFFHRQLLSGGAFDKANQERDSRPMKKLSSDVNPYVEMMYTDYRNWSFDDDVTGNRGCWRREVFRVPDNTPLDLEIGTGNGTHFAHMTKTHPERVFVGLELKYKTLVQSIRRSRRAGCENGRMVRFPAENISTMFAPREVSDVYIHFPDPWPKKRHHKNRLIQDAFLKDLFQVMAPGGSIEFKTDDFDYLHWSVQEFRQGPFEIEFYTEDLHKSFRKSQNFVTHFESLFLQKQQPIGCVILRKP
jgi:tRNA (guanine-N7-)-methyltransferase